MPSRDQSSPALCTSISGANKLPIASIVIAHRDLLVTTPSLVGGTDFVAHVILRSLHRSTSQGVRQGIPLFKQLIAGDSSGATPEPRSPSQDSRRQHDREIEQLRGSRIVVTRQRANNVDIRQAVQLRASQGGVLPQERLRTELSQLQTNAVIPASLRRWRCPLALHAVKLLCDDARLSPSVSASERSRASATRNTGTT